MSRFFASTYEYDTSSSSSEEDLLSSSEEEFLGSSSGEESEDSIFNESESEAESDYDTDDSEGKPYGPDWFKKPEFRKPGGGSGANKFLKGANYSESDEESSDEGKKVVKSAKEKLLDEMQAVYDNIETAEMSEDWISISNEFDNITRLLVRAHQLSLGTPYIFIKVVAQIEDLVSATSQNDIKNKAVARAYNTTKQRVKKVSRENEELLAKFREDPESLEKESAADMASSLGGLQAVNFGKAANLSDVATATSEVSFFTTLRIVMDSRGKKNVNQQDLLKTLEELLDLAKSPYESIMAYLTLVPMRFDVSSTLSYQPIDQWKASFNDIVNLMTILDNNFSTYQVSELAAPAEFLEDEPEADSNGVKKLLGSLFSFVERLDDEFKKSLLNIDPHSSDYLIRLKDEQSIYNLILRVQLYLEATLPADEQERLIARAFVKRLNHIYYKSEKLIAKMESNAWKSVPSNYSSKFVARQDTIDSAYVKNLVNTLSGILSKNNNNDVRMRAVLYNIYFAALNVDFHQAKDMLLNSGVQTHINTSNPSLQILFNRVVVQLGLAAFKACLIEECHQVLNELLSTPHLREILGQQTLQRISSTTDDREQQCLPYHQHINLDLIDVVFMTCSLLIEIPQMAAFFSGIKVKRFPHSQKSIRRALDYSEKVSFQGPPETLRDFVLFAAKAMQKGDWNKSIEYLKKIQSWNLLPNSATVMENLTERVQVESLKTYFFTYKRFYASFSVKKLSELFSLPEAKIITILESVISQYDIAAKFNEENTILIVEKGDEITKLEEIALKLNKEVKIVKERLNPSNNHR
ncbi:hypothetical protein NCAS_0D02280 [Naumovozyma castellii]|uniref:Eukaryotic translation initiation factor 3 subunit C n=1 Tax=Naumovozyma castellii TaxID=27288 RepID=G0VE18_NAUCA|nr:hypothetical protein NCAS_0D02280 [Naumovozyma castellii CBS 4309]CCC69809.1 hypothetical protein NCAS_0D02280 [Naumovozyma castellii CBS 4309]